MSGQEQLYVLALIISIFVIIGITICFSLLFFLYSFYKIKQINFGFEDEPLNKDFNDKYYKNSLNREKKNKSNLSKIDYYKRIKKNNRVYHNILDTITGVFVLFFVFIFIVGVSFSSTDNNVSFYGNTFLTILSSSMEEKSEKNKYLKEHDLDNQIVQYSLISLKSVEKSEDIKEFDIIAFKLDASRVSDSLITYSNSYRILDNSSEINEENKENSSIIIVHRVIDIYDGSEDHDDKTLAGTTYFTTRGDSNEYSLSEEVAISFDEIVGVYTGFNNYYLGVFIIYFKSTIGIIAILSAALFLLLASISEEKINKAYNTRTLKLIEDEEKLKREKLLSLEEKKNTYLLDLKTKSLPYEVKEEGETLKEEENKDE